MAETKQINRIWYASCQDVHEIHLLPDHTCVVPPNPNTPEGPQIVPLSMKWGKDGDRFVFAMSRMPEGVEQMSLPIVVEGGVLTGNKKNADQIHHMLKGVAIRASMAAFAFSDGIMQDSWLKAFKSLDDQCLPLILDSDDGEDPDMTQIKEPEQDEDDDEEDD